MLEEREGRIANLLPGQTAAERDRQTPVPRRDFLKGCAASAAAVASHALGAEGGKQGRPSILILESDQHLAAAMSCMGHGVIKTPHMDRLAQQGVLFTRAVCPAPLCQPSRTAMLTGRWPHQTGVYLNKPPKTPVDLGKMWTFPRELQKAGYHTALIGKTHFPLARVKKRDLDAPEYVSLVQSLGFDRVQSSLGKVMAGVGRGDCAYTKYLKQKGVYEAFSKDMIARRGGKRPGAKPAWYSEPSPLSEEDFHDAWIGRQAANCIEGYSQDQPFCLWVNWGGPHAPWDAPGRYAAMYDPSDCKLPYGDTRGGYPPGKYVKVRRAYPEDAARKVRANYYGLINVVDDCIGEIMAALEKRGMLENTIVVYTSDHGEMLGDHGYYGKSLMWRQSANVPLIVSYPKGLAQGLRFDAPVSTMDLVPTVLQMAGAKTPAFCQGRSLAPVMTGKSATHTNAVFSEMNDVKMVLTERHKYIWSARWAKAKTRYKAILFDVKADPLELRNLSGDPQFADVEKDLHRMLEERLAGRA